MEWNTFHILFIKLSGREKFLNVLKKSVRKKWYSHCQKTWAKLAISHSTIFRGIHITDVWMKMDQVKVQIRKLRLLLNGICLGNILKIVLINQGYFYKNFLASQNNCRKVSGIPRRNIIAWWNPLKHLFPYIIDKQGFFKFDHTEMKWLERLSDGRSLIPWKLYKNSGR